MQKVIIISGASGNLGKAVACQFYENNYPLHLLYHSKVERLSDFNCPCYKGSLTDSTYIKNTIDAIGEFSSFININCAGITDDKLIPRLSEEDFMETVNINLKGIFLLIREIIKKNPKSGHIINLSSISGVQGRAGQTANSASEWSLTAFTRSIAREYGDRNIQANVILPGFIPSDITHRLNDAQLEKIKSNHLLNRFQTAEEVSRFIYHLAFMKNVSGQIFNLDSRIV